MAVHTYSRNAWKVTVRKAEVESYPQLHRMLKGSRGYPRLV